LAQTVVGKLEGLLEDKDFVVIEVFWHTHKSDQNGSGKGLHWLGTQLIINIAIRILVSNGVTF
jgi:hypothetical protein